MTPMTDQVRPLFLMLCASETIWTERTLAFAGDDGTQFHYLFGLWWEPSPPEGE